jgi:hypothetical protein
MDVETIYIAEDHNAKWDGARDEESGNPLNAATIAFDLTDTAGTSLGTGTLAYVGGSAGDYLGVVQSTITATLVENTVANPYYYLELTLTQGGYNAFRRLPCTARYRGRN